MLLSCDMSRRQVLSKERKIEEVDRHYAMGNGMNDNMDLRGPGNRVPDSVFGTRKK